MPYKDPSHPNQKRIHARKIQKKNEQLGMNFSTASNALKKRILFRLVQQTSNDICHQCGQCIESVEELSVEHKTPWLDSDDPTGLFFDLDNIAFSHLSCNIGSTRRTKKAA